MKPWLIAVALCGMSAAGCSQAPQGNTADTARRQSTARKSTNPPTTVGHLAGIEAAGLTGDQRAMRGHVAAMHKNLMHDVHLADAARLINPEAARAAVRPLKDVQSAVWIDRSNWLVLIGGSQYRSMDTIDGICGALRPLGDAPAAGCVRDHLGRCGFAVAKLPARGSGRTMFQRKRQVDAMDSEVRRVFQQQHGRVNEPDLFLWSLGK